MNCVALCDLCLWGSRRCQFCIINIWCICNHSKVDTVYSRRCVWKRSHTHRKVSILKKIQFKEGLKCLRGERANRKRAWRPLCGRALKVGPCTEPLNPETQSQPLIILAKKSTNWRIRLPFSSWAWIWFELATFYRKFHCNLIEKKSTDNSLSIYLSIYLFLQIICKNYTNYKGGISIICLSKKCSNYVFLLCYCTKIQVSALYQSSFIFRIFYFYFWLNYIPEKKLPFLVKSKWRH